MTIRVEPHRIKISFKDGTVIVYGEAYDQPSNGFDYSVDTASMEWAPPNEKRAIHENERATIVEIIKQEMEIRKWRVEYL